MVGWLKALLFVTGGVTAAAGTAYVTGLLDPFFAKRPEVIASLPQSQQQSVQEPVEAQTPTQAAPAASADETVSDEKQDRLVIPTFDLLRVEPDGSVLFAGKAASNATVEVLNGDDVLVSATATAEGDFVAVLDEPLEGGDYRLALRSISGDIVAISQETAIISIPEKADGPVLAMVDAPGAPAELMAIPQPSADLPADDAGPAAETLATAPATAEAAEEEHVAQREDGPDADRTEAAEDASGEDVHQESAGDHAQTGTLETAEAESDETPTVTEAADAAAQTSPLAESETEVGDAPGQADESEIVSEPAVSAPEIVAEETASGQQQGIVPEVTVEAVEIEGDTIFIAGRSMAGGTVRVYADDILIGDALVSEGGRFLVEARRDLPVGQYVIRADLLDAAGSVLARAAVPFEREQGETIAAVAPAPERETGTVDEESNAATQAPQTTTTAQDEVTAPALQRVDGSVIIRRGDSLWRISRRVYGRGVRYSTIYLANQDQISDPNRIWPGQVFSVPQETPEGEQADMDAIGEQAVAPEDRPSAQ